ncbi:MAG: Asp-tRNA(Asn)/Glu-tRNA(Gln) amidotransferase subunit GatB [Clostridia bacterium]|nr:Asp-tRNA(Asn)/Glu-tRNA(Gln) amidotransferase subunit GatB [Clostridia bacterium]
MTAYELYETVIGLEVHVELKTRTKIFCSCSTIFGAEPNTQVCPVCLGLPGTLPVLNRKVVDLAAAAGLCLNCKISNRSKHDRKNYFYPDLPKAYQISQFDNPLCSDGHVEIQTEKGKKAVGITRIHIEEDAGKLVHKDGATLIDCNRCGVPLIEIVSEPHMSSGEEAVAFLKKLRSILLFAGVSDCKMNEGSLRCDVNLSVRKHGAPLGVRCELKNLNSFKFIEKAIEYERKRQIDAIERGETIIQETRRFDESSCRTFSMRVKEEQSQYRFFEEPDLAHIVLTDDDIDSIRRSLPLLPDERKVKYLEKYDIPLADGEILTESLESADYFEKASAISKYPRLVSNMIISEIMGIMEQDDSIARIAPAHLASVADMAGDGTINSATAKKLIKEMWVSDFDPCEKVKREGLQQINDENCVRVFVKSAIEKSGKAVDDYKKGKLTAARSIVGRAMGESRGRANPELVAKLVEEELSAIL